jgi:hypothetical protein
LSFLGFKVNTETGQIIDKIASGELKSDSRSYGGVLHTIFYVLSAYSEAEDIEPTGNHISSRQFRGNQFTRRGYTGESINLVRHFETYPEKLVEAVQALGGKVVDFPVGDIAVELNVLPRVPVTFVLSLADEEFPVEAWIYFDETIESYFDSEQTYFLTHLTVSRIIKVSS